MTTSHKLTLFVLVLARLEPYQKRLKPNHSLWIRYNNTGNGSDTIEISAHCWLEGNIADIKWFTYSLGDPSEININAFIDNAIEKLKPFYN